MTHNAAFEHAAPPRQLDSASGRVALKRTLWSLLAAAGGAYGAAAVLSYNPLDPSFNTASDALPRNIMGGPGALFADLAVQSLGYGAHIGLAALTISGLTRIVRKRAASAISPARFLSGVSGFALLSGAISAVPRTDGWPLDCGFGGNIGDAIAGFTSSLFKLTGLPFAEIFGAALSLAAAGVALGWAFRLSRADLEACRDALARFLGRSAGEIGDSIQSWRAPREQRPAQVRPALQHRHAPPEVTYQAFPAEEPVAAKPAPRAQPQQPQAKRSILPLRQTAQTPPPRSKSRAPQPVQGELFTHPQRPDFELPDLDVLTQPKQRHAVIDGASLKAASQRLAAVLADFGVQGEIVAARPGPVVTLFELEPAPGVKSSRVIGLADDIARSMSATAARVAVIPGRNAIGIELPNPKRETVYLRSLLASNAFVGSQGGLPLALGETIEGEPFAADLAKMPHLLIAGTTGSGKSVGINAMILSLLYRLTPDQCRFIMIDPKMLELSVYEGIPHLLSPVVTDPKKAVVALKWAVREMEVRYRRMAKLGVRNIQGYNDRIADALATGEPLEIPSYSEIDSAEQIPLELMPYIVVVIDEMADLMLVAGKDIEAAVQRLAQMARAAGIHLVMATQRPSVDVITGTIKANFPTRISYSVTSKIDSRTILGEQGAEQLLGMGDLLFMAGGGRIRRLHGPFVSDSEVERVVRMLKAQGQPSYRSDVLEDPDAKDEDAAEFYEATAESSGDDLFDRAVAIVLRDRKASTSYIQRRLQIGYNRAASLMERLEKEGIISPADRAGKREILLGAAAMDEE